MEEAMKRHSYVGARLSAMMFLEFFIWGAWFVTVGNYLGGEGMRDVIGWAYSVGPIAAIVSPFLLGMIADRFFATERVLAVVHLIGGAAMFCAPWAVGARQPTLFILLLLVHTLCYMPTLSLTSSLAFRNLTNQEKQFPIVRVFGTIGWIAANWLVSLGLAWIRPRLELLLGAPLNPGALALQIAGGAGVLMGLYSLTLPHTPAPGKGKTVSIRQVLGLDSLVMLKDRSYLVFIISSLLICVPLAAYYAWAPVFIKAAGFENTEYYMSWGQIAEVLFMLLMPLCFAKLGVKWMLAVGMFAWVARYGLFAGGAPGAVPWMLMFGVLLHGICYDFFFVTGMIYADKKATVEIRAQAQGFLVLVTQGVGMLAGAQISQALVTRIVPDIKQPAAPWKFAADVMGQAVAELKSAATEAATQIDAALGAWNAKLAAWQGEFAKWQPLILPHWQRFWIIPCVAAGVVLVLFVILFRDTMGRRKAQAAQ